MSVMDKNLAYIFCKDTVLVFLMGKNPKCPGKDQGEKLKYILQRLFIPPPWPVLANIHSILASELCCGCLYDRRDVGLTTQFLFNGGLESQPIAGSMPVNCVRRWLNTTLTLTERMILLHQYLQHSLDG